MKKRQTDRETDRQRTGVGWTGLSDGEAQPLTSSEFLLYRMEQKGRVLTKR